jgi:hypothetical protein
VTATLWASNEPSGSVTSRTCQSSVERAETLGLTPSSQARFPKSSAAAAT